MITNDSGSDNSLHSGGPSFNTLSCEDWKENWLDNDKGMIKKKKKKDKGIKFAYERQIGDRCLKELKRALLDGICNHPFHGKLVSLSKTDALTTI